MGKLFKLRWSLIFPSFQSCKSKDPSTLPESPIPINPNFIKLHLPPPTILPISPAAPQCHPKPDDQHVAYAADDEESRSPPEHFRWKKEDDWHIVSRVQATEVVSPNSPVSEDFEEDPSPKKKKKQSKKNIKKQSKSKQRRRISTTSSPDSEWFSSDESKFDDEASETIISSSRTLSTDSCSSVIDVHDQLQTISERPIRGSRRRKSKNITRKLRRVKCVGPKTGLIGNGTPARSPAPETVSPARLSRFSSMLPCSIEGKVRESFAVVKKSVDPFEDFKRSMVEMILEKQMVEVGELEQLLQCFLSLNSRDHHGVIVEAFAEIYEAMFSESRVRES